MNTVRRSSLILFSTLALALGSLPAAAQGGSHGGHGMRGGGGYHGGHGYHGSRGWGPGPVFWGAVGLGLGLNAIYGGPWYPGYVVVEPAPVVVTDAPAVVQQQPAPAAAPTDPVIYPRNGQSAEQTAADKAACIQWAAAQPRALSDASIYQRAILACMDGRGYTLR